jgi:5-methylcytosine-specific restriction endonuclease McrA
MSIPGRNTPEWRALCKRLKRELPNICWVCGNEIDLSLSGRDKWGWSLDHVRKLSLHPELAEDESNLRPAHMWCNATRGEGVHGYVNGSQKWG